MLRRFLCLGTVLFLLLLSVPACDSDTKAKKGNVVQDPDPPPMPNVGKGAKAG